MKRFTLFATMKSCGPQNAKKRNGTSTRSTSRSCDRQHIRLLLDGFGQALKTSTNTQWAFSSLPLATDIAHHVYYSGPTYYCLPNSQLVFRNACMQILTNSPYLLCFCCFQIYSFACWLLLARADPGLSPRMQLCLQRAVVL